MNQPISHVLHEFLHTRRILAEVARRIDMKLPTLCSQLNPKADYAKFGIDDFEKLCTAVQEMGYSGEMGGILHEYFEKLKSHEVDSETSDNLALIAASLMSKTAQLADGTTKLLDSANREELSNIKGMISRDLLPTALKLSRLIERRLNEGDIIDELLPEIT